MRVFRAIKSGIKSSERKKKTIENNNSIKVPRWKLMYEGKEICTLRDRELATNRKETLKETWRISAAVRK